MWNVEDEENTNKISEQNCKLYIDPNLKRRKFWNWGYQRQPNKFILDNSPNADKINQNFIYQSLTQKIMNDYGKVGRSFVRILNC